MASTSASVCAADKKAAAAKKVKALATAAKPKDITATINKLKGNADVKKEVAALRILGAAKRKLFGKTISARKSGFRALERLADQQSETQAGREAEQLIKSLGMP